MPFEAHNIPVLFFFTGLHPQYHRPEDDWHLIEANSEARIVQMVARLVCRLAQSSQQLQFVKVERPRPDRQQERGFRVYLGTVPDYAAEVDGVRLAGVSEGGPAAKAGLQGGDVIVEVGGKAVHSLQDYTDQLREAEPQKPLSIVVLRDGNRLTLTVVPEARP